ncbi:MAG: hypothetical protein ACRCYX_01970 [Dermatophilaceae bacterium]
MVAERSQEQVGSVADEAARLVASILRLSECSGGDAPPASETPEGPWHPTAAAPSRGAQYVPGPGAPAGAAMDGEAAPPPHDPVCQWCPICRSVAVVRQVSPETLSGLAGLAAFGAAVLTDLAGQWSSAADSSTDAGADPSTDAAADPSTDAEGESPSE